MAKGSQTSPIPGRLAYQGHVSGGGTSEHYDYGRPNTVLRMDNQSREIRTQTLSGLFHSWAMNTPRFNPCKPTQERWFKLQDLILCLKVKTCFDCKMFDVTNWVACLNGEDGPEGCFQMGPFLFHLKEHWRYPQSLDSLLPLVREHFSSPRVVGKPVNVKVQTFTTRPDLYRHLKQMLGHSLRTSLY